MGRSASNSTYGFSYNANTGNRGHQRHGGSGWLATPVEELRDRRDETMMGVESLLSRCFLRSIRMYCQAV